MRRGVTLLELLVVILLLGVLAALSGLGSGGGQRNEPVGMTELWAARLESIRTGRSVTVMQGRDSLLFHPDGRVTRSLWARGLADPVSGELANAR